MNNVALMQAKNHLRNLRFIMKRLEGHKECNSFYQQYIKLLEEMEKATA